MKPALYILVGVLLASAAWYYFDFYNPEKRLARTQQQLYNQKVKEAEKQLKTGNTTEALRNYATAKRENVDVQAAIANPSNVSSCGGINLTPDPITHNVHIVIQPGCAGGSVAIHQQRPQKPGAEPNHVGKGVTMKVSPWSVMLNGTPAPVVTMATFRDGAGSFHKCMKDGEGQICDFYGNVLLDIPYAGADIHLDFIKEFDVVDKTQFEVHGGSVK